MRRRLVVAAVVGLAGSMAAAAPPVAAQPPVARPTQPAPVDDGAPNTVYGAKFGQCRNL